MGRLSRAIFSWQTRNASAVRRSLRSRRAQSSGVARRSTRRSGAGASASGTARARVLTKPKSLP